MPSSDSSKSLQEVVEELGLYPAEAFRFVQEGLGYTVQFRHGEVTEPDASHHVSGRDLCMGLRDVAWQRWGLLARLVLARWNILTTLDFGRIVFAMVEGDLLQKTHEDTLDDFRNVYEFLAVFDAQYGIDLAAVVGDEPRATVKKSSS